METRSRAKMAVDHELHMQYIKKKVVVRHCCRAKFIGNINRNLTDDQKSVIGKTPFAWMMKLDCDVKISTGLLKEMCCRWDESRGGFLVQSEVVGFTLADVCLGLGLSIRGRGVELTSQPADSLTRSLFGSKAVKIKMLYDKLNKSENVCSVVEFCRLYILLGMAEFLFPNTNGTICPGLFSLVDNLDDMWGYNWAEVVRGYLVKSICRVSTSIKNEECSSIFLLGCSYLMQLWVVYHLWTPATTTISAGRLFPRILNLQSTTVVMDDIEVNKAFNSDEVLEHFTLREEEVKHAVVHELCQEDRLRFLIKWGREKVRAWEAKYAKLAALRDLVNEKLRRYESQHV